MSAILIWLIRFAPPVVTTAGHANSFEELCREDTIARPRTPAAAASPLDPVSNFGLVVCSK